MGVASVLAGLLLATLVVFAGWKHWINCMDASWPDTWARDMFGHADGPTSTGCYVPTAWTWLLAALGLIAPIGGWVLALRVLRKPRA